MIYYTGEMVADVRNVLLRIRKAGYFCHDNGMTVSHENSVQAQGILSDALCRLEDIRPQRKKKESKRA